MSTQVKCVLHPEGGAESVPYLVFVLSWLRSILEIVVGCRRVCKVGWTVSGSITDGAKSQRQDMRDRDGLRFTRLPP